MLANTTSNSPHATAPAAEALMPGGKKGSPPASAAGRTPGSAAAAAKTVGAGNKTAASAAGAQTGFAALLKHARENISRDRSPQPNSLNDHSGKHSGGLTAKSQYRLPGLSGIHGQGAGELAHVAQTTSAAALPALHRGQQKDSTAAEKTAELPAVRPEDRKKKSEQNPLPVVVVLLDLGSRGPSPALKSPAMDGAHKPAGEAIERKGSSARGEVKLTLSDQRRSVEGRRAEAENQVEKTAQGAKDELKGERLPATDRSELVREYGVDGSGGGSDRSRSEVPLGAAGGRDFQSLLAERLRESWNGDIVKNAHIVLKDGDAGIIRLRLKPESLGNIKIELNLSDNNISGKIVVQSDEAKHAFERNMGELADAFRQGGFDSAKLEVSVGSGSHQGSQGPGQGQGGEAGGAFYSERLRGAEPTAALRSLSWTPTRRGAVDILA